MRRSSSNPILLVLAFSFVLPVLLHAQALPGEEDPRTGPDLVPEERSHEAIRLEIIPRSARVRHGETVAFQVRGWDTDRQPADGRVIWDANGGSIDEHGTFTADGPVGRWQVWAYDPHTQASTRAWVRILPPPREPLPALVPPGNILVKVWETGASANEPRCKIIVSVAGEGARRIALFGITEMGRVRRLARADAGHADTVALAANYGRYRFAYLELRLYDARGRLMARHRRRISR